MAAIDDDRGAYDKERYLDVMFDPLVFGPAGANELELIAVRGEELCLYRTRTTTPDGDAHERIVIAEVHDGRCVRMEFFPQDRFSVAQIALDRRWLTLLGFADDHPWRAVFGLVLRERRRRDRQRAPRPLPLRRPSAADLPRRRSLPADHQPEHTARRVSRPRRPPLAPHHRADLAHRTLRAAGRGWERPGGLMLSRLGPDGRVEHMELFDFDDEPAAVAAFDRLLVEQGASATGLGPLTNSAWEVVRTERSLDGATGQHELVAVRSDRFCLTRFTGTDLDEQATELLVVSEVVDGRVERSTSFEADDLAAALTELDAWYCAEIDEPEIHDWMIRMAAAFGHGNFEDFRSLVTDDFESVDERRLGLGRRTADQWAASYVPLVGLQHPVVVRVVRHDGPIWLSEYWARFGGDGSEWHSLVLIERDGHRIRRQHEFDLEQAELAVARYEELTSAPRPPLIPALTNRAWEITSAFNDAYVAGDREATDRLVDPDGQVEYRLRLSVAETSTARSFLDFVLASHAEASDNRQQLDLVAVRGEHLAWYWSTAGTTMPTCAPAWSSRPTSNASPTWPGSTTTS